MTSDAGEDAAIKALQEQLASLTHQVEDAETNLKPVNEETAIINKKAQAARDAYNAAMEAIREEKEALQAKQYEAQRAANEAKQARDRIAYQLKQMQDELARRAAEALAEENRKKELSRLSEQFENAILGAPWRERAKDHQITAGHKITQDRFVILADPMGLGKTLSSIITADMVEKLTREASPDHPFMGEEEEVYVPDKYVWTELGVKCAYDKTEPFDINSPAYDYGYLVTDDDGTLYYRGEVVSVGNQVRYLNSQDRRSWLNLGLIEKIPSHYEKQIVNAVERPVGRRILYFCPSPLLRNVMEEWQAWSPHRNVTYIGNMSKDMRNFVLDHTLPKLQEYVIIINYEAWRRDKTLLDKLVACRFDTIIIDEAHNIKEMKTSAYKGVEYVVNGCKPDYIIPMTGTPLLNRPQELFPLLHLVSPRQFSHERDFLWAYCEEYVPEGSNTPRWKFKPGGLDLLAKKISNHFLRRTKEMAGIVLPEKTVIYHELDVDEVTYPNQAKARTHMKKYATLVIDSKSGKALQATAIIALITRLRQIETWPAGIRQIDPTTKEVLLELPVEKYGESQKIDYIIKKVGDDWEGLIPNIIEDERCVVFSQFKAPLHELKSRVEAAGYRAVILDGDTPRELRDEIRHDFDRTVTPNRTDSKWDVLLANYKAAGVGLNLTNATQLITLDEEWNPGKREQAWDRIHRIGQTQNVTINIIRTKDTIDAWLADIIDNKKSVVDGFEEKMMDVEDFKKFLEDED